MATEPGAGLGEGRAWRLQGPLGSRSTLSTCGAGPQAPGAGDGGVAAGNGLAGAGVPPARLPSVLTHAPPARPQTAGRTPFFFFFSVKLWPRELPPIHFCANHEARTDPERGHGTPPAGRFITRGA